MHVLETAVSSEQFGLTRRSRSSGSRPSRPPPTDHACLPANEPTASSGTTSMQQTLTSCPWRSGLSVGPAECVPMAHHKATDPTATAQQPVRRATQLAAGRLAAGHNVHWLQLPDAQYPAAQQLQLVCMMHCIRQPGAAAQRHALVPPVLLLRSIRTTSQGAEMQGSTARENLPFLGADARQPRRTGIIPSQSATLGHQQSSRDVLCRSDGPNGSCGFGCSGS